MTFGRQTQEIVRGGGSIRLVEGRARTLSRSVATDVQLETPELRSSPSPVRVRVGRIVRDDMLADLFELTRSDNLEAGGFLFGSPAMSRHREVRVTGATRTGNGVRGPGSLTLDRAEWERAEASIERAGFDDVLLGVWHCHPGESARTCEPSAVDLRAWAGALDYSRGRSINNYAIGLIYTAAPFWGDSWARPGLHAYVTRRDRFDRLITEPAEVL
jgi:proteasome lid subunit RPN8/RPN11